VDLEKARQAGITPPMAGFEACSAEIRGFRDAVLASAKQSDIPVIDFYPLFTEPSGAVRGDLYLEDGLHPDKTGHRLMATEAIDLFRTEFLFNTP